MRQNRPWPTLAFTATAPIAPNLCWACALVSPVTFLTGDHVMQIGFGHLISPSASSTRELGTRLGKNDNYFKGTFKMSRTDISGKCKGLFAIWKYQLDFVVYPQMFIFLLRIIFLRARHLQRAKTKQLFWSLPSHTRPVAFPRTGLMGGLTWKPYFAWVLI